MGKFPTIDTSTVIEPLTLNGNGNHYETDTRLDNDSSTALPLKSPDLNLNGKEIKYCSNGMKNNSNTENTKVSENPSTALNDIESLVETVPKSSSSRFSVQSVTENGGT